MDEFIRRADVLDKADEIYVEDDEYRVVFVDDIETIPAADVRPVVPARWISLDIYRNEGNYKCSHCKQPCYVPECIGEPMYAVCPNCGADMTGGADNG